MSVILGQNYFDTEQNTQALKELEQAYESCSLVRNLPEFDVFLISFFNTLGFLKIHIDKDQEGIEILHQVEQIFHNPSGGEGGQDVQLGPETLEVLNLFFPKSIINDLFLKTEFYLAQAYAKVGDRHKAAFYCGQTLQKQIKKILLDQLPEGWDINDFGNNCIGLA